MIGQGTTPTLTLEISGLSALDIKELWLTIDAGHPITKTLDDVNIEDDVMAVTLTQEDTLKMTDMYGRLQVRFVTRDGTASKTEIIMFEVSKVLKDGVIK